MSLLYSNFVFFALGLGFTLALALVTLICSTAIGVVLGGVATLPHPIPRALVRGYVNVLRGIPLIVNVLFVYFVAPMFGLALNSFSAAALSLSLWGGANSTRSYRAGLMGVPQGQREAARALALPPLIGFRKIILPQALRPIIPAMAGMFTLLVQSTALASLVGVPELFRNAGIVVERAVIEQGRSPAFLVYGAVLADLLRRLLVSDAYDPPPGTPLRSTPSQCAGAAGPRGRTARRVIRRNVASLSTSSYRNGA